VRLTGRFELNGDISITDFRRDYTPHRIRLRSLPSKRSEAFLNNFRRVPSGASASRQPEATRIANQSLIVRSCGVGAFPRTEIAAAGAIGKHLSGSAECRAAPALTSFTLPSRGTRRRLLPGGRHCRQHRLRRHYAAEKERQTRPNSRLVEVAPQTERGTARHDTTMISSGSQFCSGWVLFASCS
jgi:hypothetical protein